MLGIFGGLSHSLARKTRSPVTESIFNVLHYRFTTLLLFGCTILVTTLEWIGNGNKISCILVGTVDSWIIPENVINTFCFISTTFTLPKNYNSKIGHDSSHKGIGAYSPIHNEGDESYKAYYQWVPFVLFLQGLLFYLPHSLAKIWEGGKVDNIIAGLNIMVIDKKDRSSREKMLAGYIVESLHSHNSWALKMLLVEFLNFINVILNIVFIDVFLDGEFSTYGIRVLDFLEADPENRIDPMAMVFPRVTKCTYYKFGPSGTVQNHDALCVLPINIINEKIYVFLWFWLIFLTIVTFIGIIYHIFLLITPAFIKMGIKSKSMNQSNLHLDELDKHFQVGDWKLLQILSNNMEPLVFGEFCKYLYYSIKLEINQKRTSKKTLSVA